MNSKDSINHFVIFTSINGWLGWMLTRIKTNIKWGKSVATCLSDSNALAWLQDEKKLKGDNGLAPCFDETLALTCSKKYYSGVIGKFRAARSLSELRVTLKIFSKEYWLRKRLASMQIIGCCSIDQSYESSTSCFSVVFRAEVGRPTRLGQFVSVLTI